MVPHSLSVVPKMASDETLFSWCSAIHLMMASMSAEETAFHLLGIRHATRQHDLPASLAKLPFTQGGRTNDRVDMLRRHTVAGFYWPFLNDAGKRFVIDSVCTGGSNHWHRTLCAASRTLPIKHPLKWCPDCVDSDRKHGGRPYWHVEHQFPTTTFCRVHQTALHQIPGRHKHWMLPPPAGFHASTKVVSGLKAAPALELIGAAITQLDFIDTSSLRMFTLRRLQETGIIFSVNGASHDRLEQWFTQTPTAAWCRAAGNGLERLSDGKWIPSMLWRRNLSNGVRWAVLWSALGWESPDQAAASFTAACRGIGLAVGGQLTLFGNDIEVQARAPAHVWEAFAECDSYAGVMAKLQRSRGDVVRWLESDPELRASWRKRLRSDKQVRCITTIRATLAVRPNLNRQSLEELHTSEIRWLREHASRELNDLLKAVPARGGEQAELFPRNYG